LSTRLARNGQDESEGSGRGKRNPMKIAFDYRPEFLIAALDGLPIRLWRSYGGYAVIPRLSLGVRQFVKMNHLVHSARLFESMS
jgi:hypothetical protein